MSDSHSTHTTIEYVAAASAAPREVDCAALIIQASGGLSLVELREGEALSVGRRWPADVVIEDLSLSRNHARFIWRAPAGGTPGDRRLPGLCALCTFRAVRLCRP